MPKPKIALKLAKRLKAIRLKQKLTQEQVAERAGMDIRYYQRLESRNPYVIRIDTLERLAKALKTTSSRLLNF